ncbi:MAG: hypothetical protein ACFBSD_09425 [Paracoccaceae bacterium]
MRFPVPEADQRAALIDRATAADLGLALRTREADGPARPSFGDIYRAAVLGDSACRARVAEAARQDIWTARAYAEALSQDALVMFEEVRAASSGEVLTRNAGNYEIEVRSSKNRPERAFLIVTCKNGAPAPTQLVVHPAPEKTDVEALELPPATDAVSQLVLPSDHPVLLAIQDSARSFHLA